MNDPDRWHTSDRFDDDAIFADIIAHMNDDVAEPERVSRPPAADGAGTESQTPDSVAPENRVPDSKTPESAVPDSNAPDGPPDMKAPDSNAPHRAAPDGSTGEGTVGATIDETDDATSSQDPWPVNLPAALTQPSVLPDPHDPRDPHDTDDPLLHPTPQVWRATEADEYEEHFEPPPTAPLPVGDLQFWGIIAGMGGGPLLLLYLVFFNRDAGGYWLIAAIAMSVGGFALLVSRLPGHHEDDDDGARL